MNAGLAWLSTRGGRNWRFRKGGSARGKSTQCVLCKGTGRFGYKTFGIKAIFKVQLYDTVLHLTSVCKHFFKHWDSAVQLIFSPSKEWERQHCLWPNHPLQKQHSWLGPWFWYIGWRSPPKELWYHFLKNEKKQQLYI